MARSARDKLAKIQAQQERAKQMQEKANEEFERLIQPLKKKLLTVAETAADTFVREHVEEMDSLTLTKSEQTELELRIGELFAETLRNAGRGEPEGDGKNGATETDPGAGESKARQTPETDAQQGDDLAREVGQDEL